jgi:plasmid stability protein
MAMRMIGGSYRFEWHHATSEEQIRRTAACRVDSKLGNQQNGRMKTTLDLPDALVKQVKLRALRDGRKLKDTVADLLRKGLTSPPTPAIRKPAMKSARVITDPETGLPLIVCDPEAPASKMTAEELIALEQETQTQEDLERLGLSL